MNNIPIFLSSDDNYAPLVATTIASICDNTKSFIDFYVLDGGITSQNKEKIAMLQNRFTNFSLEYIQIDYETKFKNFIEIPNVTKAMYSRFLIPTLKPNLAKMLYLDVDIIVNGDISELYNQDLSGYIIGAVEDLGNKEYLANIKRIIGVKDTSVYFNSGVLLVDCERWQQENIEGKLFEIERCKRNVLKMPDQDILNVCFENNYKILPEKFNVITTTEEIVVRHFAGMIKPWQADFYLDTQTKLPKPIWHVDLFWKYAKMTPYYDDFVQMKQKFLASNVLYQRFNKMIGGKNDT